MAFVMLAPSLPWPLFLVCLLATVLALIGVLTEMGRRYAAPLMVAFALAGVMVVISDEVCQIYPWLLECWCKWCV